MAAARYHLSSRDLYGQCPWINGKGKDLTAVASSKSNRRDKQRNLRFLGMVSCERVFPLLLSKPQ